MKMNILPKINLVLKKDKEKRSIYPSHRKTQFFIRNKAEHYFKRGFQIIFRATYEKAIDTFGKAVIPTNTKTCQSVEDLKWSYQAFVEEYKN